MNLEILRKIGLSEGEIKIYSALVDEGLSSINKIHEKTGIERRNIYDILNKLIEMYQLSYEFFYTPDRKKAKQAYMLSKEISELIDAQLSNTNLLMVKALISLEFSNRIIYHLTTMRLDTLKGLGGQ